MFTVKIQCEVPEERTITVKLPDEIQPGIHELILVVDHASMNEPFSDEAKTLMNLAGSVPAFASVNGVKFQNSIRDEWQ